MVSKLKDWPHRMAWSSIWSAHSKMQDMKLLFIRRVDSNSCCEKKWKLRMLCIAFMDTHMRSFCKNKFHSLNIWCKRAYQPARNASAASFMNLTLRIQGCCLAPLWENSGRAPSSSLDSLRNWSCRFFEIRVASCCVLSERRPSSIFSAIQLWNCKKAALGRVLISLSYFRHSSSLI